MASLNKPIYFCSECKKMMGHLDDLLFIDEQSQKGFCSEECIEDFYFPLIKHFEMIEHSLRKKHNLQNELPDGTIIEANIVESVLETPDEVYRLQNELNETFYNFIKRIHDTFVIVISSVYRKEASFVFLATKTKSHALLSEFRYGEVVNWELETEADEPEIAVELEDDSDEVSMHDDQDDGDEDMIFIQLLESKKSALLAEILMNRKDTDIPFEDYTGYESCFQETLDSPDEVFEKKDKEGDVIFTYIKAFSRGRETFYYIVTCLKRMMGGEQVNVYPILALPTIDMEMCQEFRGGIRLSGPLKN